MDDPRHRLGREGELTARRHLEQRGWHWLGSNVRTPYGEVDLLFQDGETMVAVEVKTRRVFREEVVRPRQLERIGRAVQFLVLRHAHPGPIRIDLAVVTPRGCQLYHDVGSGLAA